MSRCKDCHNKINLARYHSNAETINTNKKKYYKENKHLFIERNAKRRADTLQATPPWLTEKQRSRIKNIYSVCNKITKTTGARHEVDHIVPLKGEDVCGLHVPWNLAILPYKLNRSKGNRHLWKVK